MNQKLYHLSLESVSPRVWLYVRCKCLVSYVISKSLMIFCSDWICLNAKYYCYLASCNLFHSGLHHEEHIDFGWSLIAAHVRQSHNQLPRTYRYRLVWVGRLTDYLILVDDMSLLAGQFEVVVGQLSYMYNTSINV